MFEWLDYFSERSDFAEELVSFLTHHFEVVDQIVANTVVNVGYLGYFVPAFLLGEEVLVNLLPSLEHQQ